MSTFWTLELSIVCAVISGNGFIDFYYRYRAELWQEFSEAVEAAQIDQFSFLWAEGKRPVK